MPIPNTLVPARDGDFLIVFVPNYWGKGEDIRKAKKALADVAGSTKVNESKEWVVYSIHPDTTVDDVMGSMHHPKGHEPLQIASKFIER